MASVAGKLYTPELLALAVSLADYPMREDLPLTGEARSRTCGSSVSLGLATEGAGVVSDIGMVVSACAVGQGAAAIFASSLCGRDLAALAASHEALERWLVSEGATPDWPGIEALDAARARPGRHSAIMLPWKAALDALSKASAPR